jgi:hypothetical protein
LGRQEEYAAKRRFRNYFIFRLPYQIFHSPLREAPPPTMTNEKYDLANGKWKTATPQYYSVTAYETTEIEGGGGTFCLPPALPWERRLSAAARPNRRRLRFRVF